jgi:hypothetical protein
MSLPSPFLQELLTVMDSKLNGFPESLFHCKLGSLLSAPSRVVSEK